MVQQELETFLARAHERERPVPRFVGRDIRAFLHCGILAHGFLRVHCEACGLHRVVAFSCKGRGFCPSCGGRPDCRTISDAIAPLPTPCVAEELERGTLALLGTEPWMFTGYGLVRLKGHAASPAASDFVESLREADAALVRDESRLLARHAHEPKAAGVRGGRRPDDLFAGTAALSRRNDDERGPLCGRCCRSEGTPPPRPPRERDRREAGTQQEQRAGLRNRNQGEVVEPGLGSLGRRDLQVSPREVTFASRSAKLPDRLVGSGGAVRAGLREREAGSGGDEASPRRKGQDREVRQEGDGPAQTARLRIVAVSAGGSPDILSTMSGRPQSRDTSAEIERRQIEAWRAMSAAQKLAIVSQLSLAAEELAVAGIRMRHPGAAGRELELRLGALRLHRDTMVHVFGWDPETEGY